ncbi:hypothetical protein IVB16_21580 [Bradyrhizobium sp. 183]|uniref:hypothetical protein n=1 Tax=unclassified Bradyrhizobium TaxID=2631580 RepID=UPI001FFFE421|nr:MULTISPECIES: hypothetical protein [unclassified Bradyrhizobium]UPJ77518.1 hypothetical protein IVB17_21575 [Bradyrhizobium sp. 184]UPJ85312.1 hypothetical protein IVB16_21580 [Bradyrhizobium sp. 183]
MSKAKDNRAPAAGYVLPRQVPMPRFDYQQSNPHSNSVRLELDNKSGKSADTSVKIKPLQNLRFD